MLISGDARHLPLRDKSVHCVVTSPPYFGLRDYRTATWAGGDESCDHVERLARNDISDADLARRSAQFGTGTASGSMVSAIQFRDECQKCGAVCTDLQLGLEASPLKYVQQLVAVFREVHRVLRDDGTCWLNIGDSYSRSPEKGGSGPNGKNEDRWGYGVAQSAKTGSSDLAVGRADRLGARTTGKPKDLVGIPWAVAFALRDDGWYLRSDIIWHAPNKMPESVTDRPTKSHEYVFLLAKTERYFYDWLAIAEPYADSTLREAETDYDGVSLPGYEDAGAQNPSDAKRSIIASVRKNIAGSLRNKRTVWTIPTRPYSESHFATFPPALVEPCILAGTSGFGCCAGCGSQWERVTERVTERGTQPSQFRANTSGPQQSGIRGTTSTRCWQKTCTCATNDVVPPLVFDPFIGSGTVGEVAEKFGRRWVGVDLAYQHLSSARTSQRGLPFLQGDAT